jgi:hypothetical protein
MVSGLAPFGEVLCDLFREGLGRGGCVALSLAEEERCLVDEDSDQPAFEGTFAAEFWWVARGRQATVFDRLFGFLNAVEDAACDEMKQLAAARELQLEGALDLFAGFAVGFEVAATNGKVDLLDAFRGSGEFWGGVCHKHHVFGYKKYRSRMQGSTRAYNLLTFAGQAKRDEMAIQKIR